LFKRRFGTYSFELLWLRLRLPLMHVDCQLPVDQDKDGESSGRATPLPFFLFVHAAFVILHLEKV
jgi:hypothetical protein